MVCEVCMYIPRTQALGGQGKEPGYEAMDIHTTYAPINDMPYTDNTWGAGGELTALMKQPPLPGA